MTLPLNNTVSPAFKKMGDFKRINGVFLSFPYKRLISRSPIALICLLAVIMLAMSGCMTSKKGGYYQNDGPGDPSKTDNFKDAVPKVEPLMSGPNKPYTALGKRYVPDTREIPYKKEGVASWYGKQFHGRKTSSGEVYDMYAMTAAHTTLPIPSYVVVTNLQNNRSVVLRVNDRGPFSNSRIIDLSYGAAHRLGTIQQGTGKVRVERIMPADIKAGRYPGGSQKTPVISSPPETQTPPDGQQGQQGQLSGGFFVQIGAYEQYNNAENMRIRVSGDHALQPKLFLEQGENIYRLYAGPYATEKEAEDAAQQVRRMVGANTLILDRR